MKFSNKNFGKLLDDFVSAYDGCVAGFATGFPTARAVIEKDDNQNMGI